MPVPAEIEPVDEPLVAAYRSAWGKVTAEFDRVAADPLKFARTRRLQEILRSITKVMIDVDSEAEDWIASSLPSAYLNGMLSEGGGVGEMVWTQIHQNAVQQVAQDLFNDLLKATDGVNESAKGLVRAIARDESLQKMIEGRTAQQAGKEMQSVLEKQGLYSIVYKDGSRHGLAEYSQVAIRTKTAVAYNTGTLNQHADVQFFEVFDGPGCGWAEHSDPTSALGLIVSKAEAQAFPISHPNCRRSFGPRPDVTSKQQAKDLGENPLTVGQGNTTIGQEEDQLRADAARRRAQAAKTSKTQKTAKTRPTTTNRAPGAPASSAPADEFVSRVVSQQEAEAFSQGGAFDQDFFHGTAARDDVLRDGFDFRKLGETTNNGGMMGSGAYMTESEQTAKAYSRGAESLHMRTSVVSPVDMNSKLFQDAYELSSSADTEFRLTGGVVSERLRYLSDAMGGDQALLDSIADSRFRQTDALRNILRAQGKDSAVYRVGDRIEELVVFDAKNLVVIDPALRLGEEVRAVGGAGDIARLRVEVGDLENKLQDASERLRLASGGRVRAKVKAEMADIEKERDLRLARIEELEKQLPPVVPPPIKPIINPDDIPSVEQILKEHFGWTRPRALKEQMEIRLRRVPDTADIRKSHVGWTTPVAERERAKLIQGIIDEYPGVKVPPEFLVKPPPNPPIAKLPGKVPPKPKPEPKPEPKPVGKGPVIKQGPVRDRIGQFRAAHEQELEAYLRDEPQTLTIPGFRALAKASRMDPDWASQFPEVFQWREAGGWHWQPQLTGTVATPETIKAVEGAVDILKKGTVDEWSLANDVAKRGAFAKGGDLRAWLQGRVNAVGDDIDKLIYRVDAANEGGTRARLKPANIKKGQEAKDFYASVVDRSVLERQSSYRGAMYLDADDRSASRAFYRSSDNTAYVGGNQGTRTYVHEFGHGFENNIGGTKVVDKPKTMAEQPGKNSWQKMAQEFRNTRGRGIQHTGDLASTPTSSLPKKYQLTTIYKGTDEVGYEDDFISHYMGRKYDFGDTEIISMGMEYLYAEPETLLRRDPEYFWFMVGLLSGDL